MVKPRPIINLTKVFNNKKSAKVEEIHKNFNENMKKIIPSIVIYRVSLVESARIAMAVENYENLALAQK